ncbi:hypothetical protein DL89DRAFT_275743 [Linderina pennispora]|uniref:Uncharacterized protein n=1 Tax=Linderina pennispora TaxID=61395 RepID=A0A1Y1W214_9FUNG|nr:uncharacterized protein DL89DRAFT_275743 [Linderina pennispora]ORX67325.1 hypothetical protein DL89DRAFT_275743 [Linderina pennispora]
MSSMRMGLATSVWNCGCMNMVRIFLSSSMRTVPANLGAIFCGLYETLSCGMVTSLSGASRPASMRISVVFPVPFSPSSTMICESLNSPASTLSLKLPRRSIISSWACSTRRNDSDSWRKRMFSVGILPSRKMLMPSRTENGMVTTP